MNEHPRADRLGQVSTVPRIHRDCLLTIPPKQISAGQIKAVPALGFYEVPVGVLLAQVEVGLSESSRMEKKP